MKSSRCNFIVTLVQVVLISLAILMCVSLPTEHSMAQTDAIKEDCEKLKKEITDWQRLLVDEYMVLAAIAAQSTEAKGEVKIDLENSLKDSKARIRRLKEIIAGLLNKLGTCGANTDPTSANQEETPPPAPIETEKPVETNEPPQTTSPTPTSQYSIGGLTQTKTTPPVTNQEPKRQPSPVPRPPNEPADCGLFRRNSNYYQYAAATGDFLSSESRSVFEKEAQNNLQQYCKCLADNRFSAVPEQCLAFPTTSSLNPPQKVIDLQSEQLEIDIACPECRRIERQLRALHLRRGAVLEELERERRKTRTPEQTKSALSKMKELQQEAQSLPEKISRAFNQYVACIQECCKRKHACPTANNSIGQVATCPECEELDNKLLEQEEKQNALFLKVVNLFSTWSKTVVEVSINSKDYRDLNQVFQTSYGKVSGDLDREVQSAATTFAKYLACMRECCEKEPACQPGATTSPQPSSSPTNTPTPLPSMQTPASGLTPATSPSPRPTAAPQSGNSANRIVNQVGYHVDTKTGNGLVVTTFDTPQGKIKVSLPDDMAAGDTITGTVEVEPNGKNDAERAQNQDELNGEVIDIGGQKTKVGDKKISCTIPLTLTDAAKTITLIRNGQPVGTSTVPISNTRPPAPTQFTVPTGGQQGRPIQIQGPCNGTSGPQDSVTIGGTVAPVLAESPRQLIVQNTSNTVGPTNIVCNENGAHLECPFRDIGIKLSAPKLNLLRGETTTLHVTVMGLSGIKENVPLDLNVTGAVQMSGGNDQHIEIPSTQVQADGTISLDRTLTGIARGGFGVTGTVKWSDVCKQSAVLK
jgi:hypothetical protein